MTGVLTFIAIILGIAAIALLVCLVCAPDLFDTYEAED